MSVKITEIELLEHHEPDPFEQADAQLDELEAEQAQPEPQIETEQERIEREAREKAHKEDAQERAREQTEQFEKGAQEWSDRMCELVGIEPITKSERHFLWGKLKAAGPYYIPKFVRRLFGKTSPRGQATFELIMAIGFVFGPRVNVRPAPKTDAQRAAQAHDVTPKPEQQPQPETQEPEIDGDPLNDLA